MMPLLDASQAKSIIVMHHYDTMASRNKKQDLEGESPLEKLRIELTDLTQDEFIHSCGFARATYQRLASDPSKPLKLTPQQIVAICRTCKIPLEKIFEYFGVDLSGIPSNDPAGQS
jgi:hypothetical protein